MWQIENVANPVVELPSSDDVTTSFLYNREEVFSDEKCHYGRSFWTMSLKLTGSPKKSVVQPSYFWIFPKSNSMSSRARPIRGGRKRSYLKYYWDFGKEIWQEPRYYYLLHCVKSRASYYWNYDMCHRFVSSIERWGKSMIHVVISMVRGSSLNKM